MRKTPPILLIFFILCTQASFLGAQLPGAQLRRALRLIDQPAQGTPNLLTSSSSVLELYPELKKSFREALGRIRNMQDKLARYRRNPPRNETEWGDYLETFARIQRERSKHQTRLRQVIAGRLTLIENSIEEKTFETEKEKNRIDGQALDLTESLSDVEAQITSQLGSIRDGASPTIMWPQDVSADIRGALEEALRISIVAADSEEDARQVIRRHIRRFDQSLGSVNIEIQSQVTASNALLTDYKNRVLKELKILGEAQVDLAINAALQEATNRSSDIANRTFGTWQRLNPS